MSDLCYLNFECRDLLAELAVVSGIEVLFNGIYSLIHGPKLWWFNCTNDDVVWWRDISVVLFWVLKWKCVLKFLHQMVTLLLYCKFRRWGHSSNVTGLFFCLRTQISKSEKKCCLPYKTRINHFSRYASFMKKDLTLNLKCFAHCNDFIIDTNILMGTFKHR